MIKIKLFLKKTAPVILVDKDMLEKIAAKGYRYEIVAENEKPDLKALARKILAREIERFIPSNNILEAKGIA